MPLSSTRVIPPGWSEHHRPVSEGAQTAKIRIYRPSELEPTFDPETGTTTPVPPAVIYDGPARVQDLRTNQDLAVTADQGVPLAEYRVSLPAQAPPILVGEGKDWVETYETEDAHLIGRKLFAERETVGSLLWDRYLYCSGDQARNNPDGG